MIYKGVNVALLGQVHEAGVLYKEIRSGGSCLLHEWIEFL